MYTVIITISMPGPLQRDGGFTDSLMPARSAIDTGDTATCRPSDQREVPRPQGWACDIGSVEYVLPDEIFADDFALQVCAPTSEQQPDSPRS